MNHFEPPSGDGPEGHLGNVPSLTPGLKGQQSLGAAAGAASLEDTFMAGLPLLHFPILAG